MFHVGSKANLIRRIVIPNFKYQNQCRQKVGNKDKSSSIAIFCIIVKFIITKIQRLVSKCILLMQNKISKVCDYIVETSNSIDNFDRWIKSVLFFSFGQQNINKAYCHFKLQKLELMQDTKKLDIKVSLSAAILCFIRKFTATEFGMLIKCNPFVQNEPRVCDLVVETSNFIDTFDPYIKIRTLVLYHHDMILQIKWINVNSTFKCRPNQLCLILDPKWFIFLVYLEQLAKGLNYISKCHAHKQKK